MEIESKTALLTYSQYYFGIFCTTLLIYSTMLPFYSTTLPFFSLCPVLTYVFTVLPFLFAVPPLLSRRYSTYLKQYRTFRIATWTLRSTNLPDPSTTPPLRSESLRFSVLRRLLRITALPFLNYLTVLRTTLHFVLRFRTTSPSSATVPLVLGGEAVELPPGRGEEYLPLLIRRFFYIILLAGN